MNKQQRRDQQLQKHYDALNKLAAECGIANADGKKLSVKLLSIEKQANKAAVDYCNGDMDSSEFKDAADRFEQDVQNLFNRNLKGFFVNGDPRGCTLKIKDDIMIGNYAQVPLNRDMGGYGLLAPDITGD